MQVSPITETRSGMGLHDRTAGNNALSQAMLRILERVVGPNIGSEGCGSVTKRLRSNGAKVFRGITGVASNVAEYWMDATERIMDDLDFTAEEKLKEVVYLLRDESYQWWLTIKEDTQLNRLTWDLFKIAFQSKYVGASYIDSRRLEFLNLTQEDCSVAKYEAEFLRLSRYARGMVVTEYERCVRFEDGLQDSLRVLIAPQRERDFSTLVKKAKITEEVKRTEHQNRDRGKAKRDAELVNSGMRPRKKAMFDGPVRVGPTVTPTG
ncbi:uncharacterized protein [Gossypium hirsutum]|uniref:Retrotransposon gag domain-containing protein n=1 Tax=Gossypium hirsutum TaxID=3635 RepID=A0A1U8MP22_GOSHI|nr:uncharacterized protein LOC107935676 [Gossypium hirsutum]